MKAKELILEKYKDQLASDMIEVCQRNPMVKDYLECVYEDNNKEYLRLLQLVITEYLEDIKEVNYLID